MIYNLDAIQEQQDYYLLKSMNQGSEPEEPEAKYDFYLDEITDDEETFETPDGIVLMHNLVEYVRDAIDERVTDLDTAIETVEKMGGYQI